MFMSQIDISADIKLPNLFSAVLQKTGPVEINIKDFMEADISDKQIIITYNEDKESFIVNIERGNNGSN